MWTFVHFLLFNAAGLFIKLRATARVGRCLRKAEITQSSDRIEQHASLKVHQKVHFFRLHDSFLLMQVNQPINLRGSTIGQRHLLIKLIVLLAIRQQQFFIIFAMLQVAIFSSFRLRSYIYRNFSM